MENKWTRTTGKNLTSTNTTPHGVFPPLGRKFRYAVEKRSNVGSGGKQTLDTFSIEKFGRVVGDKFILAYLKNDHTGEKHWNRINFAQMYFVPEGQK